MSLRDALAVILHEHQGPYQRVGEFDPKRIYGCQWGCDWTGPNTFGHAGHVADRLIAYLRDNLAEHGDELGMTRETRIPDACDCGNESHSSWCDDDCVRFDQSKTETRFVTDWSRADD